MNAAELLQDLERRDVRLTLNGDSLRIDAPQGMITEELEQTLTQYKPELVELIRHHSSATDPAALKPTPATERVADMSFDQLAQAGLIVTVSSEVLGQDVLFVSDNVSEAALANRTLPIYRADELRRLALFNPSPIALRAVHISKTVFQGRIADVKSEEVP